MMMNVIQKVKILMMVDINIRSALHSAAVGQ